MSSEDDDLVATVWLMMNWKNMFKRATGSDFPDSYFCFDVETSGFNREKDLILEWGHCLVSDRVAVDRNSVLLNWYESTVVPADWLDDRLARLAREMELADRAWHITPERLKDEGINPIQGVKFMHEMLTAIDAQNLFMVSHNGWGFDVPMIENHIAMDLGIDFQFNPGRLIDTGSLEKASQLIPDNPAALPHDAESLEEYCKRISAWRAKGVYYNLDNHCLKKYKLDTKYNINPGQLHAAGDDAWVLHLLMEEFRTLYDNAGEGVATPAKAPTVPAPSRPSSAVKPATPKTTNPVSYRKQRNR